MCSGYEDFGVIIDIYFQNKMKLLLKVTSYFAFVLIRLQSLTMFTFTPWCKCAPLTITHVLRNVSKNSCTEEGRESVWDRESAEKRRSGNNRTVSLYLRIFFLTQFSVFRLLTPYLPRFFGCFWFNLYFTSILAPLCNRALLTRQGTGAVPSRIFD